MKSALALLFVTAALAQDSSLVASYDFVTFSGNTLTDTTGNGHDATPVISVPNRPYFSAPFSSTGDAITIVLAFSGWVGNTSTFLSFGHGTSFDFELLGSASFSDSVINANALSLDTVAGESSSAANTLNPPQVAQHIWAVVYDSAGSPKVKYYLDGSLLSNTNQGTLTGAVPASITGLFIGARQDGANTNQLDWQYLNIYNTAKTDGQIATITSSILGTLTARQNLSSYTYYLPSFHNIGSLLAVLASTAGTTWTVIPSSYSGYSGLGGNFAAAKISNTWWLAHEEPPTYPHGGLGTSADGVNWTYVTNLDFGGVAIGAPSWFVDSDSSVHLLFFLGASGPGSMATINEAHPTNAGYTTWSSATVLSGLPVPALDPFIVKQGSTYYCWYKNETSKFIEYATASVLTGPYTVIKTGNWAGWGQAEEISLIQISGAHWRAYFGPLASGATVLNPMAYSDSLDSWATWSAPTPLNPQAYYNGVAIQIPAASSPGGAALRGQTTQRGQAVLR